MKINVLIASLVSLGFLAFPASPAFAQNAQAQDSTDLNLISSQTQEVPGAKKNKKHSAFAPHKTTPKNAPAAEVKPQSQTSAVGSTYNGKPRTQMDLLIQNYLQSLPVDWDNPGQSFVAIGPYINTPIQFSGNNLIINDPKINTDVALLKLRKAAHEGMVAKGIHTEDETHHSHLLLSGILEGQAQYIQFGQQGGNPGSGKNGSSTDIDLSAAEIDAFLLTPSSWVSGFMSLSYDNGTDPFETNSRVMDSRLFLNNAFIMMGDFMRSPFYGSLGQMYVPFGTYASVFISSPGTKTIGRTKARAVLVGYQGQTANSFYTSLYTFKGDSHASSTSRINNGGVNVGYRFDLPLSQADVTGDVGMGWLANVADSVGMQNTGNQPSFNGFAGPTPYGLEKIVHRVPALNVRGMLSIAKKVDLIAEYIGVTTSFNPNDLSFNAAGAKPWGVNLEAAYTFQFLNNPASFGIGYSQAREALALGLAERRFAAVLNTSLWHNTIQSLEFRHDINYAMSDVASGSLVAPKVTGLGTSDNVVTLHFDLFF